MRPAPRRDASDNLALRRGAAVYSHNTVDAGNAKLIGSYVRGRDIHYAITVSYRGVSFVQSK